MPDGTTVNVDGGSTVGDGSVTAPDGTVVAPDGEGILPEPDYVPPSRPTYRPEVGETDGGTVKVSPSYPHRGDTVTVTPVPDEGQEVRDVVGPTRTASPSRSRPTRTARTPLCSRRAG